MKLLLLLMLCVATRAFGAVIGIDTTPAGPLGTAITATTTATSDQLALSTYAKNRAVIFTIRNTAGTATVEIQQNCTGNSADWAQVANSPRTFAAAGAGVVTVQYPFCQYRGFTTACTGCNVLLFYNAQPDL